MLYSNFGFSISSDIELPFLIDDSVNSKTKIQIVQMLNKPELIEQAQEYSVNVTNSEKLTCKVIEHPESLIMDFDNHVLFQYIKHNEQYIFYYYCYKEFSKDVTGRLVGRYGMTYLLTWMGMTVLHGSAVSNNKRAFCFVADSGVGKSSMASLFVANGCKLVADELIVLDLKNNKAILLPSSPYLHISDNTLQKVPLSHYPCLPLAIQLKNGNLEKFEVKNCVDLRLASSFKANNCFKIIILNRVNESKVEFNKLKKIDAYLKLLHYLYTPIIFPFMRKNLLALMNFIEIEEVCYSDCFLQFEKIKKNIEEY